MSDPFSIKKFSNKDVNEKNVHLVENMDIESGDFNSNMRIIEPVCPLTNQTQLIQDMDVTKGIRLPETLSNSVTREKSGPAEGGIDEDESRSSGIIDFIFKNVEDPREINSKNEIRLLSDPVMIRCLPWKILLVFSGVDTRSSMGMFLQCNAESPSTTWTCFGRASLELVSQIECGNNKKLSIKHIFAHKENDWGYREFINYADLFNLENGYVHNKTIHARVTIEAEAPHGAEWDSKRFTGFVGLKNQGATCYLNSVLQALYCTNKLRNAVFRMPTESDDSQTSVPLALQRTFYELQCSTQSVETEKLTRSFGWATWDSFMQHDAQELCRVLLDNIENKMKGTDVEEIIPTLFSGKMLSYIKCKHVEYESKREENFYDIQLKVKSNRDIHEAFKEYIQVETLANENKYDAGKYGLQEAEKGVKFVKFPPVLYLQLMRFQYDFQSNTNVKINDRFEFPYELDVKDYLLNPESAYHTNYFLHAVLVHSGDHHGGHYVVFINPRGDNTWYQFDDDVVSRCSPRDAIEMNYGMSEDPDIRTFTNAYMLVYISTEDRQSVLCPVTENDIPLTLCTRFLEEQSVDELKRKEKDCAHEFTTVYLLLEEDFSGFEGLDLFRLDMLPIRSVRVRRNADFAKLLKAIASVLQLELCSFRLWQINQREKGSYWIELNKPNISDIGKDSPMIFWAQIVSKSSGFSETSLSLESYASFGLLLFFKYFDMVSCSLSYCGHIQIDNKITSEIIIEMLKQRAGLSSADHITFYKESFARIGRNIVSVTLPSLLQREAIQGEVIYFEMTPNSPSFRTHLLIPEETGNDVVNLLLSPTVPDIPLYSSHANSIPGPICNSNLRMMSLKSDCKKFPQFLDYYTNYRNQVEILLVDKLRKADPGFFIRISPNLTYDAFAKLVATYLSAQPDRLQFFASQSIITNTQGQQGLLGPIVNDHLNGNPISNQIGVNLLSSCGSPANPDTAVTGNGNYSPNSNGNQISAQWMASKASGFQDASPQFISTLSTIAHQALMREPPGPPIPSTVSGTVRDFFNLPINIHPTHFHPTNNSVSLSGSNHDRPPQSISRFSGHCSVSATPFGNINFPAVKRIYYAHIALPIDQLESLKQLQIIFTGPRISDRLDLLLSVPVTGTVADLLNEARPHVTLVGSQQLRLLEVRNNRIENIFPNDFPLEKIDSILNSVTFDMNENLKCGLRIEEIPPDEVSFQSNEVIIFAAHFNKDTNDTFGVPFTIRIRDTEPYSAVKDRIRKRFEVTDKEFDAWNFVLVTKCKPVYLPFEEDVCVDVSIFNNPNLLPRPWLGVEHKPNKRPRYAPSEKPIKIHN